MVVKAEQQRIKALLKDTITLLCKNGLAFKKGFSIDALIGVTLDDDNVLLVSINETVKSDIVPEPPSPDDGGGSEEEESYHAKPSPANRGASPSRKRARIIPKREPPDPDDDGGVWDQGGPPLLSLDSTLDDSSFQSSEPNHSMPPSRRPIKQSQDSDSEDNDGNDVIVIKEELDREDWSMSSCSQQTGPGRPFGGGGGGDMGDQGDRDLAAVLQSGSLVPMGMQQQGQGGGMAWPANRSSTMTSDGSPGAAGDGTQMMLPPPRPQVPQEILWPCTLCGRKFTFRHNLRRHMDLHEGRFRLFCGQCGKGFMDKRDLRKHTMARHTENT